MKITTIISLLILSVTITLHINCKKESVMITPSIINTNPQAYAGEDWVIFVPTDSIFLQGATSDRENNIRITRWKKIAGPPGYNIENPDLLGTKLNQLEIGVYQFELSVEDSGGLKGSDTCIVTVVGNPQYTNTIVIENLTWIFPWYSALNVAKFHDLVPKGSTFNIYVKRDNNPNWIEANLISQNGGGGYYEYFIETRPDGAGMYTYGSLYIFYYGQDVDDKPDVKIIF
jgi:hypothetical protein